MAKHFGTNVDTEDTGMVTARKEFDEKKKALADAFARKARALAEVEDLLGERSIIVVVHCTVEPPFFHDLGEDQLVHTTGCTHLNTFRIL